MEKSGEEWLETNKSGFFFKKTLVLKLGFLDWRRNKVSSGDQQEEENMAKRFSGFDLDSDGWIRRNRRKKQKKLLEKREGEERREEEEVLEKEEGLVYILTLKIKRRRSV